MDEKKRVQCVIKGKKMERALLHINTEIESRVFLFGIEMGIAEPKKYFDIEVSKGNQSILLVSEENKCCLVLYNVKEWDDYWLFMDEKHYINYSQEEFSLLCNATIENIAHYVIGCRHGFQGAEGYCGTEDLKLFLEAGERGNSEAQFKLGVFFERGCYFQEALEWYLKSANQKNCDAQCKLGDFYNKGIGVKRDVTEAMKWYLYAAEQKSSYAQSRLGYCYYNLKEPIKAVEWFEKAIANGDRGSIGFLLGDMVLLEIWAKKGNAEAQYKLGGKYYSGYGSIEKNKRLAFDWFTRSAEQENRTAQYYLGYLYLTDEDFVDYDKAKYWLSKAEENKDLNKLWFTWSFFLYLGYALENGPKDFSRAFKCYLKAAEDGDAEAMRKVGDYYKSGRYIPLDNNKAEEWYRKASFKELDDYLKKERDAYEQEMLHKDLSNYRDAFDDMSDAVWNVD